MAEIVGSHLLMAGHLLASDPQLAYAHAEAARRRAARLSITREATGEAAYAAGEYAVALQEFRALRRMNGGNEFTAVMADCERALGRPDRALTLVREALAAGPDFTQRVELRLVEAGARMDLGQADEALRILRSELETSAGRGTRAARVRLRYGYAAALETTGDLTQAERWFAAAAALDTEGSTDADDRLSALQGMVLEVDEDDLVGGAEDDEPAEPEASEHTADESDVPAPPPDEAGAEPDEPVAGSLEAGTEPQQPDEQEDR